MKTICWECKKATCGCSWSKYFKPVEGWEAEPTTVKDENYTYSSYLVKSCPEFEPDNRRVLTNAKIAKMFGVSERSIQRWDIKKISETAKAKGYNLKYSWADKIWYELRG